MCLSLSLTFFCLLLSLYLGLQKPNGMWVNFCAVLLNIFVIFFSYVFVIVIAFVFVFAFMASRTNWCVSECSHRRPSSLSQRGFHWQLCLCVYIQIQIYLCLSVWALYLHVCLGLGLCLCLCSWLYIRFFFFIYILMYFYIFGLEGSGTNWRVSEWAVS